MTFYGCLTNMLLLQNEISSGMDGLACEAIGPSEALVFRLSSLKQSVIAEALTLCNSH